MTDCLPYLRGALDYSRLPTRAARAVSTFLHEDNDRASLERLILGFRRLTLNGVTRIAAKHSGVCQNYVKSHWSTLADLRGILWWNDGHGETRIRLINLAWKKGK